MISSVWEIICWTTNMHSVGNTHNKILYHANSIPHESFDLPVSELQQRGCFCKQTALFRPTMQMKLVSIKVDKCKTLVIRYPSQSWCKSLLELLYCWNHEQSGQLYAIRFKSDKVEIVCIICIYLLKMIVLLFVLFD